jgi:hypothetical protein
VLVASQYRYLTDGIRSLDEAITLLRETRTDFIFQGWVTEWQPLVDNCALLPTRDHRTKCERAGYSYAHLREAARRVKEQLPGVLLGGGLLMEFLYPGTIDPITGREIDRDEAWEMALDPGKWGISLTREEFHSLLAAHQFRWTDDPASYRPKEEMRAFFPDITNPEYRALLLNLARKQIDCGVDVLWIDALFGQARFFKGYAARNPSEAENATRAAKEAFEASSAIIDEIHAYGEQRGRPIYIISWPHSMEFPYPQPELDGIVTSPSAREVLSGELDQARWEDYLERIRQSFGQVPIFARIDYGEHDQTPLAVFSQQLTREEQRAFLETADRFFTERGVHFIYPLHGGYMGRGAETLSFGRFRSYDSLAPEFATYETIRTLARGEDRGNMMFLSIE